MIRDWLNYLNRHNHGYKFNVIDITETDIRTNRWIGLGLGAIGLVLLLASILSSILAALFAKIIERK